MVEEKAKQLIKKYIDGNANDAEIDAVEEWYAELSFNTPPKQRALKKQEWESIQRRCQDKKTNRTLFVSNYAFRIAASVIIILSLLVNSYVRKKHTLKDAKQTAIVTSDGQWKKLTLTDGSKLTLGPRTRLIYPDYFASHSRTVELVEGEVFFDIAHDKKKPFDVKLNKGLKIKVLGTSFLVSKDRKLKHLKIQVVTGKVTVSNNQTLLSTLVKDEQFNYSSDTRLYSLTKCRTDVAVSIRFEGATLAQVINRLQYLYDIKIICPQHSLLSLKSTATFNSRQQPHEILDILCRLHGLHLSTDTSNTIFEIKRL